ncbi:MAG: tRNA epoxyqueuosine(34) reductase QueG [Bacteroidota bacterium]
MSQVQSSKSRNTAMIKQEALRLGFSFVGMSKAEFLKDEAPRLESWLKKSKHGEMSYMERNFDKRLDPRLLVEGAQSVVSLMLNYYPEQHQPDDESPRISRYAYGRDYHLVIKEKLKELVDFIRQNIGEVNGRVFTDSAPVLERAWAVKSGLGWMGKNTNVIHPKAGSYFFLAELISDLELEYDAPIRDYCGTCSRCIDACPTEAIIKPYVVDGSKCISYFTIELRDAIPDEMKGKFENHAFGCDICQEVCPWNRFSLPTKVDEFKPDELLFGMKQRDWLDMTQEVFDKVFEQSPIHRTGLKGMQRNVNFLRLKGGSSN